LIIGFYPSRSITHRNATDQNIFAISKVNEHGPYRHFGPVIAKSIFDKSFMNQLNNISCDFPSLSINNSFASNSNVLLIMA
jgi:hypothetical protein